MDTPGIQLIISGCVFVFLPVIGGLVLFKMMS